MAVSVIPNEGKIKNIVTIKATQADYETVATVTMPSFGIIAFKASYASDRPVGIRLVDSRNRIIAVAEEETDHYKIALCEAVFSGEYALQVKTETFTTGNEKVVYYIAIY